jgi:hypothetical protein
MRATLHLVSTRDYRLLRPLLQPMLSAELRRVLRDRTPGLELEPVVAAARACLEERPRTFDEVRAVLRAAWPRADERALGYAVRTHLPLVQVPVETRWGWPGAAAFAVAESWIGAPLPAAGDPRALVLRYLAAFGPAGPRDAETWSGVVPLRETFEAHGRSCASSTTKGRSCSTCPRRPPGEAGGAVRFLPDYDNLLLAHAGRTGHPGRPQAEARHHEPAGAGRLPVEGFVAARGGSSGRASAALLLSRSSPCRARPGRSWPEGGAAALVEQDADLPGWGGGARPGAPVRTGCACGWWPRCRAGP